MYVVNTNEEKEPVTWYNWNDPIDSMPLNGRWLTAHEKYGRREHWYSEPLFIDTETSHQGEDEGWIHQWAVSWCGCYIIGRRAEELVSFLVAVDQWNQSRARRRGYNPKNWKVLGYIHNMGYDMEYMRAYFPEQEPEFFAVKPHRILTAKWKQLEIRCSYLLTQKGLAKWAKDSKADHPKLVGTYDYDLVRTPNQPLTETDWAYQLNDVAAMADSWHNDRQHDGYTAMDVPLTSTGFVRADCRAAAFADGYWRQKLFNMQPEIEVYNALEKAFAGGYTHGNRFYKSVTVNGPIGHRDFASSYPARQELNGFPMGKFIKDNLQTLDDVKSVLQTSCALLHVAWRDPELKTRAITAPYLSWSKCSKFGQVTEVLDNGRVIKVYGTIDFWCTEYDFLIMCRQYKGAYQILDSYTAPKGKLPEWLRKTIMNYYRDKCTLKHSDPITYMVSKGKLNGIYGQSAERYIRNELVYEDGEWTERRLTDVEREAALLKTIAKKNTFLPFAWGVWTTALARYALFECIELVGYERYLYSDTDSIFYMMNEQTETALDAYNRRLCRKAETAGAYVVYKGERFTLGEFTPEDDMPCQKFRFVHSKCYAIEDNTGKLKVTIAGVTKKGRGGITNAQELGNIDNLSLGFRFEDCGGTRIVYNNVPLHYITVNGCRILAGASAVIMPSTYIINDADNMDLDDLEMADMILAQQLSDTYGDFVGIK